MTSIHAQTKFSSKKELFHIPGLFLKFIHLFLFYSVEYLKLKVWADLYHKKHGVDVMFYITDNVAYNVDDRELVEMILLLCFMMRHSLLHFV